MYRRSRSCHTLSSCPWAERQNLVYGFSVELAIQRVGIYIPLSPSLGLSQRAETALFEQICRDQHHHGKVLFMVPFSLYADTAAASKFIETDRLSGFPFWRS